MNDLNEMSMISIPLDNYEELIALETRVNVAATYVLHGRYPDLATVMHLLGTPTALDAAKKLEE